MEKVSYQKHLGLFLHQKITFKHCIHTTFCKVDKGNAVIKKLRHVLQRKPLLTKYKVFLRSLKNDRDIICAQPHNRYICGKLVQCSIMQS